MSWRTESARDHETRQRLRALRTGRVELPEQTVGFGGRVRRDLDTLPRPPGSVIRTARGGTGDAPVPDERHLVGAAGVVVDDRQLSDRLARFGGQ